MKKSILFAIALALTGIAYAKINSDLFMAYNETDNDVTIAVGRNFPQTYTIRAHGSRALFIDENERAITIRSIK